MARSSHRGLGRRGKVLLTLLVGALIAFVATRPRGGTAGDRPGGGSTILAWVPADAFVVAVVDVRRLRSTELGQRLLGQGRDVAGLGNIVELCGADPMDRVDRLALAVPERDDVGFGLFADGALVGADIVRCAETIVTSRGGRAVQRREGAFFVMKDSSAELSSAQLAVRDGGPLVLGEPPYVAASLALGAAGDGAGTLENEPRHRALRDSLEADVLVATAVLSAAQRETLRDELQAQRTPDSPFRAVAAAGLGVSLSTQLALHAVLQCDDAAACEAVAKLIDEARRDEAKSAASLLSGLGAMLERLDVKAQGPSVHLRLAAGVDEALTLVTRVLALRRLAQQPPPAAPTGAPSSVPDSSPAPTGALPAPSASAAPTGGPRPERLEPAPE